MHSAAILAGGRALRFDGRDKGALLVEGRSIRDRQLEMLSSVADDVLIVGARSAAGIPPDAALRIVPDVVPDSGPLGGVHAALTHAARDAVLVLACDMPYVTAPFARQLLSLAGDADVVVPQTERGYHPLCGVYTRRCVPAIERRLAARELAMRLLFDEVRVRVVSADEIEAFGDRHRLLANVNTPDEYAAIDAFHGHGR
jgi:molybdopterin-guanine dinucleotide biosynthesis protein A